SHYKMAYSLGLEKNNDFIEAINNDNLNPVRLWGISHLYLELGFYSEQLKRYLEKFLKEQIYILKFEDFIREPAPEIKKICRFLGIQTDVVDSFQVEIKNETKTLKNAFYSKLLFAVKNHFILKKIKTKFPPELRDSLKKVAYTNDSYKKKSTLI